MAAARSAGLPIETLPCVASRVDPFPHLLFEWKAFGQLTTDRPIGMTQGAIPWTSIDRYADRYGIVSNDFDRFARLIRAMDATYLIYSKDKNGKP